MRAPASRLSPCLFPFGTALTSAAEDQLPPQPRRPSISTRTSNRCWAQALRRLSRCQKTGVRSSARTRDHTLAGGDRGWLLDRRKAKSLLIRYVGGLDPDITMPPRAPFLPRAQVGLLGLD
ncbi:MAG: hypothetical protein Ct9H300mP1_27660 [Planctomycetaceae bacterium]|nr:MAG: hypothetical protein Ct9H300mP1_27660 [Planctomycetaceae bacterium]